MLNRFPDNYPSWRQMLADIGRPTAHQVARAFRVPVDLAQEWETLDQAPPVVCMALYWLTTWGRNRMWHEVARDALLQQQMADAARREAEALRAELARVISSGDFGCANDPSLLPVSMARPLMVVGGRA